MHPDLPGSTTKAMNLFIRSFLTVLAAVFFFHPPAHSQEASSPEVTDAGQIAVDFSKAMLKGDAAAAKALATKADASHIDQALKEEKPTDFVPSLVKVTSDDKQSTATAIVLFPGKREVPLLLVREDAQWKVAFLETTKSLAEKAAGEPKAPVPKR
jgi:hypothetical protein